MVNCTFTVPAKCIDFAISGYVGGRVSFALRSCARAGAAKATANARTSNGFGEYFFNISPTYPCDAGMDSDSTHLSRRVVITKVTALPREISPTKQKRQEVFPCRCFQLRSAKK